MRDKDIYEEISGKPMPEQAVVVSIRGNKVTPGGCAPDKPADPPWEKIAKEWERLAKDCEYRNMVLLSALKAIINLSSASKRQRQIAMSALKEIRRDAREHDPEPNGAA